MLATYDDHKCGYCGFHCADITDEHRGQVRVECVYCGTGTWVTRPRSASPSHPIDRGEFRFDSGRFSGLTIPEAAAEPNGLEYIRWRATQKNCSRCKIYLDSIAT